MNLLDDSDDDRDNAITINAKFAKRFEDTERKKELEKAKYIDLEGENSDDESSDESEDEDAEQLNPDLNAQIIRTINSIRRKDPTIYNKDAKWFNEKGEVDSDNENEDDEADRSSGKKKRYKDVLREQLLKDGADIDHENDTVSHKRKGLVYDREQEDLRKSFLQSVKENMDDSEDDEDDDGESVGGGDMLKVKPRKAGSGDDVDYQRVDKALNEMKSLAAGEEEKAKDDFLADYIGKQKWLDKTTVTHNGDDDDELNDDDDEDELDKVDHFESKYNFRFEELQDECSDGNIIGGSAISGAQVLGHARNVEGSVRRVDDKRKREREARAEKKERERRQKEAELRRLKNLKMEELKGRLRQISKVGGLKGMDLGGIDETVLDEVSCCSTIALRPYM